jgi:lipoprotein-releasing system permease protein
MYKLFLTIRYLRRRRIAFFAIGAVALCTMMVLVVMSVMGGFLEMVKERSRGLLGDVVMDNASMQGFPYYQEFIEKMNAEFPEEIKQATPVIYSYGILRFIDYNITKPVRVVGVRLDEYVSVNDFANSLFYEKYYPGTTTFDRQKFPVWGPGETTVPTLPEPLMSAREKGMAAAGLPPAKRAEFELKPGQTRYPGPGVYYPNIDGPYYEGEELPGLIIGAEMIGMRKEDGDYDRFYVRGEKVILSVMPLTRKGAESGAGTIQVPMRYTDDSLTGVFEIDKICVYGDFDLLQRQLGMEPKERMDEAGMTPARASQISFKFNEGVDAVRMKQVLQEKWVDFHASMAGELDEIDNRLMSIVQTETWEERQREFITAVEKEKVLVTLLFAVISVVAVFMVGCIFYMVVQEKTRDIGIIKSVGASSGGVAAIFLTYGAAVGVVGSTMGTVLGIVFVKYINEMQDALAKFNPALRVWSPSVYTFDRIPNHVDPNEVTAIVVIAIVASMVGAVAAAIRAARVWPVEALRYE